MNTMEKGWLALATSLVVGSAVLSGASPIVLATSVTGIMFVVLVAFKNQYANLFGFLLALMFGSISYEHGYYMNAFSNLFYIAPASLFGWWYWTKNKDKPVETLANDPIKVWTLVVILLAGFVIMAYRATVLGSNHPIVDGVSGFLPLVATFLLIMRFKEQWFLWIPYNALEVYLWFSAASVAPEVLAILAMRVVFLANSILGAYTWYKVK